MEHYLWYAHKKALKYVIHSAVCNLYEVFFLVLNFQLNTKKKKQYNEIKSKRRDA